MTELLNMLKDYLPLIGVAIGGIISALTSFFVTRSNISVTRKIKREQNRTRNIEEAYRSLDYIKTAYIKMCLEEMQAISNNLQPPKTNDDELRQTLSNLNVSICLYLPEIKPEFEVFKEKTELFGDALIMKSPEHHKRDEKLILLKSLKDSH